MPRAAALLSLSLLVLLSAVSAAAAAIAPSFYEDGYFNSGIPWVQNNVLASATQVVGCKNTNTSYGNAIFFGGEIGERSIAVQLDLSAMQRVSLTFVYFTGGDATVSFSTCGKPASNVSVSLGGQTRTLPPTNGGWNSASLLFVKGTDTWTSSVTLKWYLGAPTINFASTYAEMWALDEIKLEALATDFTVTQVTSVPTAGGRMRLTGTGFLNSCVCTVESVGPCDSLRAYSATELYCYAQGALGTVTVTLKCLGVTTTATMSYYAPTIHTASDAVQIASDTTLTFNGTDLGSSSTSKVFLDDTTEISSSQWQNTSFVAVVPAGCDPSQHNYISAVVGGQQSNRFYLTFKAPSLSSTAAKLASPSGGDVLSLTGSNFPTSPSALAGLAVTVNLQACCVVAVNHTTISCTAPPGMGFSRVEVAFPGLPVMVVTSMQVYSTANIAKITSTLQSGGLATVTGTNFGKFGIWPVRIFVDDTDTAGANCAWLNETQVVCPIRALNNNSSRTVRPVYIEVNGEKSNIPYNYSHQGPSITTAQSAPTIGGEISIKGVNLLGVTATIGGKPCPILLAVSTTEDIKCIAPPGSGTVNLQVSNAYGTPTISYSYQSPNITSWIESVPALGGNFFINGTNFGPAGTSVSIVVDGVQSNATWKSQYRMEGCFPGGHGTDHQLFVSVDGAMSTNMVFFDYMSVEVYNVTLPFTEGGKVTLYGANFAASTATVVITLNKVTCTDVAITSSSTITFVAPKGTGAQNSLEVEFRYSDGNSDLKNLTFAYQPPTISSLSVPSEGQASALLLGKNFCAEPGTYDNIVLQFGSQVMHNVTCVSPDIIVMNVSAASTPASLGVIPVTVYVDNQVSNVLSFTYSAPVISDVSSTNTEGGLVVIKGSSFGPYGTGACVRVVGANTSNVLVHNHTHLTCNVSQGIGQELNITVESPCDSNRTGSSTFSYNSPTVTFTSPTNAQFPTRGGYFVVNGNNFGPSYLPMSATLYPSTNLYIAARTSHTQFTLFIPEGTGTLHSIAVSLQYTPEFYLSISHQLPYVTKTFSTSTLGGRTTIIGGNFGTNASLVEPLIGGSKCTDVKLFSDENLTCTVPAGSGSVTLTIQVDGQRSNSSYLFTYQSPYIIESSTYTTPTSGGQVTIYGTNFGPSSTQVYVTVAGEQCTGPAHTHTSITCLAPAGYGANLNITVDVSSFEATAYSFSYDSPSLNGTGNSTTSGGFISIYGSNLGPTNTPVSVWIGGTVVSRFDRDAPRSMRSKVVGGTECTHAVVFVAHTEIRCLMPAGTGKDKPVHVSINGVYYPAVCTFSYAPPEVQVVSSDVDYDGGYATISGANFGGDSTRISAMIGQHNCSNVTVQTAQIEITCYVSPGNESYTLPVVVTVDGQQSQAVNIFKYVDLHPPSCTLWLNTTNTTSASSSSGNGEITTDEIDVVATCSEGIAGLNISDIGITGDCVATSLDVINPQRFEVTVSRGTSTSHICVIVLEENTVFDKHNSTNSQSNAIQVTFAAVPNTDNSMKSKLGIILGSTLGGVAFLLLLIVLVVVAVLCLVFTQAKRITFTQTEEGEDKLGKFDVTYDQFDESQSQLVEANAFMLRINTDHLSFGLGTHMATVDEPVKEEVLLENETSHSIAFKIFPPSSSLFKFKLEQTEGVIEPGYELPINIDFVILCTTHVDSYVFIAAAEGNTLEGKQLQHIRLPVKVESKLSFKLDPFELTLFKPAVGEGTFGFVFRGTWRDQDVAIKVLKDQESTTQAVQDFEKEVHMLEMLHHPNIVHFYGAVRIPPKLAIVTEFLDLGSLTAAMVKHHEEFGLALKLQCLLNCAQGMEYLHKSGILHRDLKGDNLLMCSLDPANSIVCKLTDFGTTRAVANFSADTQMTKGIGSKPPPPRFPAIALIVLLS
eukprot:TRINITY_DN3957_c0_g1_i2.p1 TRINITY_DN3957_c0_g1~~TRINITY_DN3957_c0_g1_i2.p1  ORF type:complete len:1904 (-),score=337.21 TRINITY_DN3957_c0_g1_i2:1008-6683(-)